MLHTLSDVGIPMIAAYEPLLVLAFIPIVLIEAASLSHRRRAGFIKLLWPVTLANLLSAIVGVPLTWLVLFGLELLLGVSGVDYLYMLSPAWLGPMEGEWAWVFTAAGLWLCVPFCLASAWTEWFVLRQALRDMGETTPWRAVLKANLLSYLAIGIFWLVMLAHDLWR